MNSFLKAAFCLLILTGAVGAQESGRDQKIKNIFDLREQINLLEQDIMRPDQADIDEAQKLGFTALRLLPREKYDGVLKTNGGGSYFSFARNTHEYGYGSDVGLERGNLKVGFAGADYGFLADLGNVPLQSVTIESPEINFLVGYKPPTDMVDVRREQSRSNKYETPSATFSSYVSAMVSHSYVLRSIGFDKSDVLIALKIMRKDADGSLVLFWKTIKTYEKPLINREAVKAIS